MLKIMQKEIMLKRKSNNNFLIDSHCHLHFLEKIAIDKAILDAGNNNVKIINNVCASIEEANRILEICNNYNNVFGSIGIHPSEIRDKIIELDVLLKYFNNEKICSIGETGLDYHFEPFDKVKQKKNFEVHIEVSRKTKLPLIIHSRDCDSDMIDILKSEIKNGEFSFVLHCFCSGKELAYKALDLGGYISFSGILTFKNSFDLQDIAKNIPVNKILVETDSPFLAPVPMRGKENSPEYVKYVAEFLSKLLNMEFDEICKITTDNFFRLFSEIVY